MQTKKHVSNCTNNKIYKHDMAIFIKSIRINRIYKIINNNRYSNRIHNNNKYISINNNNRKNRNYIQ